MPLLAWLLNCAYAVLLVVASPVILWRAVRYGKYRDGLAQKVLGLLPRSEEGERVIWFHAVSVGEVLQLETIIPPLAKKYPDATVLITSTTNTGLDIAKKRFPQHRCSYFPLDFSWAVKTALRRVRPELVVLVELELWPNFVLHTAQQAKLAIINGRMSGRSFRRYVQIQFLLKFVLRQVDAIGAQTEVYADRLRLLGASGVTVTGSIKFDRVEPDRDNDATLALRDLFDIWDDEIILVAGSTQAPEEQLAVKAWKELRRTAPHLRLIVVPRHQERFDEVAAQIAALDVPVVRRSQLPDGEVCGDAVVLLDTLGELRDCWGLADIAFVGGSFGDRGGQNMIEPAGYGAAVIVGPNTSNFSDVVMRLQADNAIVVASEPERLLEEMRFLLGDPTRRYRVGSRARRIVLAGAGASAKTVVILSSLLGEVEVADEDHHELAAAA